MLDPKCAALTKFQPISSNRKNVIAKKQSLALEPLKSTAPYNNYLHILRGQIANKGHHLGQIANNVNTQINNKVNESANHSLGGR